MGSPKSRLSNSVVPELQKRTLGFEV